MTRSSSKNKRRLVCLLGSAVLLLTSIPLLGFAEHPSATPSNDATSKTQIIIENKHSNRLEVMKKVSKGNTIVISSDSSHKTVTVPEKTGKLKIITEDSIKHRTVKVDLPNGDVVELRKGPQDTDTITIHSHAPSKSVPPTNARSSSTKQYQPHRLP